MLGTKIYKPINKEEYKAEVFWCFENNAHIVDKGLYYETVENDEPTEEDIRELRASAYQEEVDPITSHIQRLKDEEQTEEIIAEIELLKVERSEKVESIKERFPYPEKPNEESVEETNEESVDEPRDEPNEESVEESNDEPVDD